MSSVAVRVFTVELSYNIFQRSRSFKPFSEVCDSELDYLCVCAGDLSAKYPCLDYLCVHLMWSSLLDRLGSDGIVSKAAFPDQFERRISLFCVYACWSLQYISGNNATSSKSVSFWRGLFVCRCVN